jgi:hypothetical protein
MNKEGFVLNYPLELGFKIVTVGTRVRVTDAAGRQVAFVRKEKFKLKEDVRVYADEDQRGLLFRIKADRVVDFGASYSISGPDGRHLGAVRQQSMGSLWKSSYVVSDPLGAGIALIHEENPFVKVFDSLAEALPFADALGGLFLTPRTSWTCAARPSCGCKRSGRSSRAGSGSTSWVPSPRRKKGSSS